MKLVVVVNGENVELRHRRNTILSIGIDRAIELADCTHIDRSLWQLKDNSGTPLDERLSPKDLGLAEGDRLFLTLPAGVGA